MKFAVCGFVVVGVGVVAVVVVVVGGGGGGVVVVAHALQVCICSLRLVI